MSIGFCVPALFDADYANALAALNVEPTGPARIVEMYGAVPHQTLGSLRTGLAATRLTRLRAIVELANKGGISFNYLFNTSVLDGREETVAGRDRIHELVDAVLETGVRRFTVAVPFLIRFLRTHYPEVEVVASVVAGIQSAPMAQRYLDMGVSRIIVVQDVNRRLDVLEALIGLGTPVEVLVNSPCLHACPDRAHHANLTSIEATDSMAAAYGRPRGEVATCLLHCRLDRFSDPAEVMRIPWIRPEDIPAYHSLGIGHFKLDGRNASASYNLERIRAYLSGRHEGNLLYLLMQNVPRTPEDLFRAPDDFYRIYVDNEGLGGHVGRMPCLRREMACHGCGFCDAAAAGHVRVDPDWAQRRRSALEAEIAGRYTISSPKP